MVNFELEDDPEDEFTGMREKNEIAGYVVACNVCETGGGRKGCQCSVAGSTSRRQLTLISLFFSNIGTPNQDIILPQASHEFLVG